MIGYTLTLTLIKHGDGTMENYKLQHLANGNSVIDEQLFNTEAEMETYIDEHILPNWEEGDSINCNGVRQIIFDDYYTVNRY